MISAFAWGTGDFIAKKAVDQIGPHRTLFYVFLTGAVFFGLSTFLTIGRIAQIDLRLLLLTLLSSLLCAAGYFLLYYGFQVGSLSVVSTITAGGAIVPVLFSIGILKESPGPDQLAGIGLVISGVVLVSMKGEKARFQPEKKRGVVPALASSLLFGTYVILVKLVSERTGPFFPLFMVRGIGVVLIGIFLMRKRELALPPAPVRISLLSVGVLDTVAFLAFTTGMNLAYVAVVSPLSSLFTVVTVLLARLFLKERLSLRQKIGFVTVVFGVIAISL